MSISLNPNTAMGRLFERLQERQVKTNPDDLARMLARGAITPEFLGRMCDSDEVVELAEEVREDVSTLYETPRSRDLRRGR